MKNIEAFLKFFIINDISSTVQFLKGGIYFRIKKIQNFYFNQ